MPAKQTHQPRIICACLPPVVDAFHQFLALVQRLACHAGAFYIAPYQFIRIQVRCITRQELTRLRNPMVVPDQVNTRWSMYFVNVRQANGWCLSANLRSP